MLTFYVEPIQKVLSYITSNPDWEKRDLFKGGTSVGSGYYSRWGLYNEEKFDLESEDIMRKKYEGTTLKDIVSDNLLRLTAFAGLERVITLQQGLAFNQNRFLVGDDGFFSTLRATFVPGVTRGYFKGYLAYIGNFLGVSYNSLLWAQGSNFASHLLLSTLFETAFYPLDTLKTLMNHDLKGEFKGYSDCFSKVVVNKEGLGNLYKGLGHKLAYNCIFIWNLRNLYDNNTSMYVSMPIWMLSYALLGFKTKLQLFGSSLSQFGNCEKSELQALKTLNPRNLYGGFVAFTLLNTFFAYNFIALYSDKTLNKIHEEYESKKEETRHSKYERYFS